MTDVSPRHHGCCSLSLQSTSNRKVPSWGEIDIYPFIYRAALQTHLAQTVMDEEVSIHMQVNTTGSRKAPEVPQFEVVALIWIFTFMLQFKVLQFCIVQTICYLGGFDSSVFCRITVFENRVLSACLCTGALWRFGCMHMFRSEC